MFKGLGIWQSNLSPSNVYPLWALPIMGTAPSSLYVYALYGTGKDIEKEFDLTGLTLILPLK